MSEDTRFRDTLQRVYHELVSVEGMHDDADAALDLVHGLITRLWNSDGTPRDVEVCVDARHDVPCALPCPACATECG